MRSPPLLFVVAIDRRCAVDSTRLDDSCSTRKLRDRQTHVLKFRDILFVVYLSVDNGRTSRKHATLVAFLLEEGLLLAATATATVQYGACVSVCVCVCVCVCRTNGSRLNTQDPINNALFVTCVVEVNRIASHRFDQPTNA